MKPISRRFVLQGSGVTLALPMLTSLLSSKEAEAQMAAPSPSFIHFASRNGACNGSNIFPTAPALVEKQTYAGREIRRFDLAGVSANGSASVSRVLSAPANVLTPGLLAKMNVIRGLDIPFYVGHQTGAHLGNFSRNDGNGAEGVAAQTGCVRRTIDQVMGGSRSFYPDLSGVRERVLVLTGGGSYNYQNPSNPDPSQIQDVGPKADSPKELFDVMFPNPGPAARAPIVDKVLENYRRLRSSSRISAADKVRLDTHLDRVAELERRIKVSAGSCQVPEAPNGPMSRVLGGWMTWNPPWASDPAQQVIWYQLMNDVLVAALGCGLTRIVVSSIDPPLLEAYPGGSGGGPYHALVAHSADQPAHQEEVVLSQQRFFSGVFADLASKLDAVITPDGKTLLDRTLLSWTQEFGQSTHNSIDIPVVTFGSAAGFLKTGQHVDYRNLNLQMPTEVPVTTFAGILWHQWLGTALQAMRVPKLEWENAAVSKGYPDYNYVSPTAIGAQAYGSPVWSVAGDVLPWLKA